MKKNLILISVCVIISLFSFYIILAGNTILISADERPSELIPSPVYATLPKGSVLYDGCDGKAIDMLLSGSKVEIIKDRSAQWYYIRFNNKMGWVKREALNIPEDERTDKSIIDTDTLTAYADKSLESKTDHIVWVDIARQRIYILKNQNNKWQNEKTIICSTGKNTSPTLRGQFEIQDRGEWFYSQRLGSGAKYWVRYNGSYLFHSVAMDKNKNIKDPTLGRKSSSGCVRMGIEDAEWFFRNIEKGSLVIIN